MNMAKSKVELNALKSLKRNIVVAVRYGFCLQFALLQFFLLFVNFHVLHPWQWLKTTFTEVFCVGTVISITPLLMVILFYDVVLYNRLMHKKRYYASRFSRLMFPLLPKMFFLFAHMLLGLTSAWLYASYLPLDYRQLTFDCYGGTCLNSRYLFLLFCGFAAGCYSFGRKYAFQEPDIEFPIIQQRRLVQIRTSLYFTFYTTLWQTLLPTFALSLLYGIINNNFYDIMAHWLRLNTDESMESIWCVLTDMHLLFYAWLLQTHIISNFNLLFRFYCIVLSDQPNFPISANITNKFNKDEAEEVTLAKALRMNETPLVQKLAALQLYKIAEDSVHRNERQEIFSLTSLSDHPYNWHQLSIQCLCLITSFTEELESAVKKISNVKISPHLAPNYVNAHQTTCAIQMAQKMLCRQQNENAGIRRLWTTQPYVQPVQNEQVTALKKPHEFPKFNKTYIYKLCCRVPCINYLFGESETGKSAYLLSNAQYMVWLTQGLAGLCALSLQEDRYGVVQSTLADIFSALLKLKFELEKLNNVNLKGKKLDRSLLNLKNAVKRSLYKMCSAFGDYLRDIVTDPQELQQLQCFVSYQEI